MSASACSLTRIKIGLRICRDEGSRHISERMRNLDCSFGSRQVLTLTLQFAIQVVDGRQVMSLAPSMLTRSLSKGVARLFRVRGRKAHRLSNSTTLSRAISLPLSLSLSLALSLACSACSFASVGGRHKGSLSLSISLARSFSLFLSLYLIERSFNLKLSGNVVYYTA